MYKFLLLICLLALIGCGTSETKKHAHTIGRDKTWFPLQLGAHSVNLTAFSTSLIQEISKVEGYPLELVNIDWVQLFENLDNGQVGGILTSLTPNLLTQHKYSFSEPIVYLGPVLIVSVDSPATSLIDMEGQIVGVYQFDDSVLVAQEYPSIIIQLYQSEPTILEDLTKGKIDGVLMPSLDARALVFNTFPHQLKIISEPLNTKGIRLITLKDKNKNLIRHFNRGLKKLRDKGTYSSLRQTYNLD